MCAHDAVGERQAEPVATRRARGVPPIEALEDVRQVFGGDAGPGVQNRDRESRVLLLDADENLASRLGIFQSVVDQDQKQAMDSRTTAGNPRGGAVLFRT